MDEDIMRKFEKDIKQLNQIKSEIPTEFQNIHCKKDYQVQFFRSNYQECLKIIGKKTYSESQKFFFKYFHFYVSKMLDKLQKFMKIAQKPIQKFVQQFQQYLQNGKFKSEANKKYFIKIEEFFKKVKSGQLKDYETNLRNQTNNFNAIIVQQKQKEEKLKNKLIQKQQIIQQYKIKQKQKQKLIDKEKQKLIDVTNSCKSKFSNIMKQMRVEKVMIDEIKKNNEKQMSQFKIKLMKIQKESEQFFNQQVQIIQKKNVTNHPISQKQQLFFTNIFSTSSKQYPSVNNVEDKQYLIEIIEKCVGKRMKGTKLLYFTDPFHKYNAHQKIDGYSNYVVIIRVKSGELLACFSVEPCEKQKINKGRGFISSLSRKLKIQRDLKKNNSVTTAYDDYNIIFGNSDLRISASGQKKLYMEMQHRFSSYEKKYSLKQFTGSESQQMQFIDYEVHQIFFEEQ